MNVIAASAGDIPAWLALAAEVEPLFGPMVDEAGFRAALRDAIDQGRAWCVREADGPVGSPLVGGLITGGAAPEITIGWLAVAEHCQRSGIGRGLVEHLLSTLDSPARISVTTFADGVPGGGAARGFYDRFGFETVGPGAVNPASLPTQVMRLSYERRETARAVMQRGDRFLMAQHHYMRPVNFGKWSLPGGRIDPADPTPEAALRRELAEEFQVEADVLRHLGTYRFYASVHHVYHVRPHGELIVDPNEIAAVAWLTVDEVRAVAAQGRLFAPFMLDAICAAAG